MRHKSIGHQTNEEDRSVHNHKRAQTQEAINNSNSGDNRKLSKTTMPLSCMSCPNFIREANGKHRLPYPPKTNIVSFNSHHTLTTSLFVEVSPSLLQSGSIFKITRRNYTCCGPCGPCGPCGSCRTCGPCGSCGHCGSCGPCGSCGSCGSCSPCNPPCDPGCLPPPCNTPAKCLQWMSGYYYYPYGGWFCGPYHVASQCTPVNSPCVPCPKCTCPVCICPGTAIGATGIVGAINPLPEETSFPYYKSPKHRHIYQGLNRYRSGAAQSSSEENQYKWNVGNGCTSVYAQSTYRAPVPPTEYVKKPSTKCPYNSTNLAEKSVPSIVKTLSSPYCSDKLRAKVNQTKYNNFSTKSGFKSPQVHRVPSHAFFKSLSDFDKKGKNTPIHYRVSRKCTCDRCILLKKPREILSREERDRPDIKPREFDYTSIPQFRCPYPQPFTDFD